MNKVTVTGVACLMLLLTGLATPPPAKAAQQGECSYTEAETASITAARKRLVTAGILLTAPDMLVDTGNSFTRAEFATLLTRAMGRDEEAQQFKADVPFPDVANHWAAGYITLLNRDGVIKGFPGGSFEPNSAVSLVQVKIMLARLLRVSTGADPNETDTALRQAGMNTDVPCATSNPATRAQVYLLVDRALSVPFYARFQIYPPVASQPVGFYPPDVRTGIPEIDKVIQAVAAQDGDILTGRVSLSTFKCSAGIDAPRCAPGAPDGTPIQALPSGSCQINLLPEGLARDQIKSTFNTQRYYVYAAFDLSKESDWHYGAKYGVILGTGAASNGITLYIDSQGAIVQTVACGGPENMVPQIADFILPPGK